MKTLSEEDKKRYHRQMIIPGWEETGQLKLRNTTIGVVGTGGLGSTVLIQLAVCGFGKIILADKDRIELSNLNRQVLHWEKDMGKGKVDSAREKLVEMNSGTDYEIFDGEVTEKNVDDVFSEADALIDGLDNFPGRYLLNKYAVRRGIPFFHGAIWGLEGRATTILPGRSPCFRCLYPEAESTEMIPVAGFTPGLIANVQVTEAVKWVLGLGDLLAGRLLLYDGESMEFTTLNIQRDPECPVCSQTSPL